MELSLMFRLSARSRLAAFTGNSGSQKNQKNEPSTRSVRAARAVAMMILVLGRSPGLGTSTRHIAREVSFENVEGHVIAAHEVSFRFTDGFEVGSS